MCTSVEVALGELRKTELELGEVYAFLHVGAEGLREGGWDNARVDRVRKRAEGYRMVCVAYADGTRTDSVFRRYGPDQDKANLARRIIPESADEVCFSRSSNPRHSLALASLAALSLCEP